MDIRKDIVLIAVLAILVIEIGAEEVNGVVLKNRVNANDICLLRILIQMPPNNCFVEGNKLPEWAALTLALVLYTPIRPPVLADRLISRLARFRRNKALSENIFPASEQTSKNVQPALNFRIPIPFWRHWSAAVFGWLRFAQRRRAITFQSGILLLQFMNACSQATVFSL